MKNLVVIAVVIFFVGDAVKSLLLKRQESIISNLQQAKQRVIEMEQNLLNAQKKFENASAVAQVIKNQNEESIKKQEIQSQEKLAADLQRLKESTVTTIANQKRKTQKKIYQGLITIVINRVERDIQYGFTDNCDKAINVATLIKFLAD